jgi:riboflavin kinase/FMN adenylyltransferase
LLDFDGDLYGRPLRIAFRRYLRGQVAFADIGELERQMRHDIAEARAEPLEDSRRIGELRG